MVDRPGLQPGIAHGERLESAIDQPMEIDLPWIIIVGVDNPISVIDPGQTIERADLRLNGNPSIKGTCPANFTIEIGIESKVGDDLPGFRHASPSAESQPDVLRARSFLDHVFYGLDHFRVGPAFQNVEGMLGTENVD